MHLATILLGSIGTWAGRVGDNVMPKPSAVPRNTEAAAAECLYFAQMTQEDVPLMVPLEAGTKATQNFQLRVKHVNKKFWG